MVRIINAYKYEAFIFQFCNTTSLSPFVIMFSFAFLFSPWETWSLHQEFQLGFMSWRWISFSQQTSFLFFPIHLKPIIIQTLKNRELWKLRLNLNKGTNSSLSPHYYSLANLVQKKKLFPSKCCKIHSISNSNSFNIFSINLLHSI